MRIVLDTNILHRKYRLDSPDLTVLAKAAKGLDHSVLVPEVVLDELTGKWRKEVATELATIDGSGETLKELTDGQVAITTQGWDIDALALEYRRSLEVLFLVRFHATVLPYPSVGHSTLAAQAVARRRPFKDIRTSRKKGVTGYRDALIWASILEVLGAEDTDVALVSHDRSAFASEDGESLHAELVEDLRELGHHANVVWFDGLDAFLAQEVTPRLEHLEALLADLTAGTYELQSAVQTALDERLGGLTGLDVELLRSRSISIVGYDPRLTSVVPFEPWRFEDAIGLEDGTYILKAQRDVTVNYEAVDEHPEDEGDWQATDHSAPVRTEVACLLNPESGETETSAVSFKPIPVPPQVELQDLEERARAGSTEAITRVVALAQMHPNDSGLALDGLPLVQGPVLHDLVAGSPDTARALVRSLRRALAEEDAWGNRDFNHANEVLGWLLDVTRAALAGQDHQLASYVADVLFDLEPAWQRFALRRRTRRWLLSLQGEGAQTIAAALARHPEEVAWLRAEDWDPSGGADEVRAALGSDG